MQIITHLLKLVRPFDMACQPQGTVAGHLQGGCQALRGELAGIAICNMECLVGSQLLHRVPLLLLLLRLLRAACLLLWLCTECQCQQTCRSSSCSCLEAIESGSMQCDPSRMPCLAAYRA